MNDDIQKKYLLTLVVVSIFTFFDIHISIAQNVSPRSSQDITQKIEPSLELHDFAYGIEFTPDMTSAIQAIALPEHFYQHIKNKDGGDFRIFDRRGLMLPVMRKHSIENISQSLARSLDFFTVYGTANTDLDSLSLSLDGNDKALSLHINNAVQMDDDNRVPIAYIVDANILNIGTMDAQDKTILAELEFSWREPGNGFINGIYIEESNDLVSWKSLVTNASLSRFQHQTQTIGNNKINIGKANERYLRISWPQVQTQFELSEIVARYKTDTRRSSMANKVLQRQLRAVNEDMNLPLGASKSTSFYFELPGDIPVTHLHFVSDESNYFFRAHLYSRSAVGIGSENEKSSDLRWTKHGQINQYKLNMSQQLLLSDTIDVSITDHQQWLVVFDKSNYIDTAYLPRIDITWQPEFLLFFAQGSPPYTLAYGNPMIGKENNPMDVVFLNIEKQERDNLYANILTLPKPKELGGLKQLQVPSTPLNWKPIVLWAVLLLGVLIMALMARAILISERRGE